MTPTRPNPLTESVTAPALPAGLRHLVLTGFMGAGKSTIGRLLASRLDWKFLDLDTHLEQRTGATIPELFERHGESSFRRLEASALASALTHTNIVLALGGGTAEERTNQLLLEQTSGAVTIFLDAPFPILYDRCMLQDLGHPGSRPVLTNSAEAELRFTRRHPLYRRIARLTIDTSELTPPQTVDSLLHQISSLHLSA